MRCYCSRCRNAFSFILLNAIYDSGIDDDAALLKQHSRLLKRLRCCSGRNPFRVDCYVAALAAARPEWASMAVLNMARFVDPLRLLYHAAQALPIYVQTLFVSSVTCKMPHPVSNPDEHGHGAL